MLPLSQMLAVPRMQVLQIEAEAGLLWEMVFLSQLSWELTCSEIGPEVTHRGQERLLLPAGWGSCFP